MSKSSQNAGCAPVGCIGLLILFAAVGKCGAGSDGSGSAYAPDAYSSSSSSYTSTPPASTYAGESVTMYSHGTIAVRTGPNRDASLVRTLSRGDEIRVGPKDARGWAPVLSEYGGVDGYVYRASSLIRSRPPASRRPRATRRSVVHDEIDHAGASARCRDGSLSYSAHRRGTCSHHGGVSVWY